MQRPDRVQTTPNLATDTRLAEFLRNQFADPETSWAIGTWGAIAEFHRDTDEAVALSEYGAVTARGGIQLSVDASVQPVAWERPTSGDAWTQGIALCLPADASAMNARTTITELGPDSEALLVHHRGQILFDLGIGAPQCDVHVRTADPKLLALLREAVGRAVLTTGLLPAIAGMNPTRVFVSKLGRVEVCTPIPTADGKTPDGPHTHVLPDLLRLKRTHSANVPLPENMVPCAELFPASAINDPHGHGKTFDAAKHAAFQSLIEQYGDPICIQAKHETRAAVRAGAPPSDVPSYTRAQRLVRRVALRQLLQIDGRSPALDAWGGMFDRGA